MRYSIAFAALAATASARSVSTRQARDDCDILNYALTLEHLENTFYRQGVANYSQGAFTGAGFADPFYKNLLNIAADEKVHVDYLTAAITAACPCAVKEAKYAFGTTDPKSFITLSAVLEGVGVSAYLGAAASIANKLYLTVAGSILTVEARHASYIRSSLGQRPFPEPFDTPLSFNPVFSLAAQFITGFDPSDTCTTKLPFKPFPALALECSQYYYEEDRSPITFTGAAKKYGNVGQVYAVFFSGLDKAFIPVRTTGDDFKIGPGSSASGDNAKPIPAGYTGQVYVALTKSATDASDANLLTSPAIVEVYPKGQAPPNPAKKC
ncbi:MAG: hypothetical protein M1814_005317 [Vezdaea aestivalis]|nr:MAG: hypothetical protein M1814_005317 [Vezdaea aestivalis]